MRIILLALLTILCSCSDKSGHSSWLSRDLVEPKVDFVNTSSLVEHYQRGQYLVNSIGACGYCHATDLGGRAAPNISSDKQFGVGSWTLEELVKVLKGGKKKNGRAISPKTHKGLAWIADRDARAIAIYLLSSRPVKRPPASKTKEFFSKVRIFNGADSAPGYVVTQKENANASYGRYLTLNVASCSTCHGADSERTLSGIDNNGPSLRKVGAKWSKEQIANYLSTGQTPGGKQISPESCPWGYYRYSNAVDKQAIAFFLKTLS